MNYLYLILPMFSVYFVCSFFPIQKDEIKNIAFKPPPWIFGVVWPILLLLIGYSWTMREELTIYYLLLTFLLSSWCILNLVNKVLAFVNILITIGFTIYLILHKFKKKSSYLLIPLVAWLSFASYLAYNSI